MFVIACFYQTCNLNFKDRDIAFSLQNLPSNNTPEIQFKSNEKMILGIQDFIRVILDVLKLTLTTTVFKFNASIQGNSTYVPIH